MNTPNGWGYCGTGTITSACTGTPNGVGSAWDGNNPSSVVGYACLDGIGRGQQSDAMNGANFPGRLNVTAGNIIAWPHQMLEPVYAFNNTISASPIFSALFQFRDDSSQNNRDGYFDCGNFPNSVTNCTSGVFDGTQGTGSGTTCRTTGYFSCTAGPEWDICSLHPRQEAMA